MLWAAWFSSPSRYIHCPSDGAAAGELERSLDPAIIPASVAGPGATFGETARWAGGFGAEAVFLCIGVGRGAGGRVLEVARDPATNWTSSSSVSFNALACAWSSVAALALSSELPALA